MFRKTSKLLLNNSDILRLNTLVPNKTQLRKLSEFQPISKGLSWVPRARNMFGTCLQDLSQYITSYITSHVSGRNIKFRILSQLLLAGYVKRISKLDEYIKQIFLGNNRTLSWYYKKVLKTPQEQVVVVLWQVSRLSSIIEEACHTRSNENDKEWLIAKNVRCKEILKIYRPYWKEPCRQSKD